MTTTTENPSGVEPTGYCVLVSQEKAARVTRGGIEIPETAKDRIDGAQTRGRIIAVSPLAFDYAVWPEGAKPKVGDLIYFKKFSWASIKGADDVDYWLIQDKDVQAICQPKAFQSLGARNAA